MAINDTAMLRLSDISQSTFTARIIRWVLQLQHQRTWSDQVEGHPALEYYIQSSAAAHRRSFGAFFFDRLLGVDNEYRA
ncbi:hypothetical protein FRC06_007709, partial [Ceratobasidium sp. 370]